MRPQDMFNMPARVADLCHMKGLKVLSSKHEQERKSVVAQDRAGRSRALKSNWIMWPNRKVVDDRISKLLGI